MTNIHFFISYCIYESTGKNIIYQSPLSYQTCMFHWKNITWSYSLKLTFEMTHYDRHGSYNNEKMCSLPNTVIHHTHNTVPCT